MTSGLRTAEQVAAGDVSSAWRPTMRFSLRPGSAAYPQADVIARARQSMSVSRRENRCPCRVPVAVKDNIDVAGIETTAACPAFALSASQLGPRHRPAAGGGSDRRRQNKPGPVCYRPLRHAQSLWSPGLCVQPRIHQRWLELRICGRWSQRALFRWRWAPTLQDPVAFPRHSTISSA